MEMNELQRDLMKINCPGNHLGMHPVDALPCIEKEVDFFYVFFLIFQYDFFFSS